NAAIWGEVGSWGILYFHPINVYGYIGFRYQDQGLAGLLNYDFGASYRLPEWRLRGGLRGFTSALKDTYTANPDWRNTVNDRVDNTSMRFYSVNPTVTEVYVEGDYLFNRQFEAGLGFAQSLYGVNYSQGYTILAMIRFRLPTDLSDE